MKVVLLKDVKDIGHADTVKDISDGYARNFLIPKGLAVVADKGTLKSLEERVKARTEKLEKERAELKSIASKLNGVEISIKVDAGQSGKVFGSVTHQDIAKKIHEALGIDVDKRKIVLDQPIKETGSFNVPVKFASDISASLKVNVTASAR
jgi:large subunit ribosomal protein L9